jgi:hypothetical protein
MRRPRSADEPLWEEPSKAPSRPATGRYEPSTADRSAAAAMSAMGLFRPESGEHVSHPGKGMPRGRWGRAIESWTAAGCPEIPQH